MVGIWPAGGHMARWDRRSGPFWVGLVAPFGGRMALLVGIWPCVRCVCVSASCYVVYACMFVVYTSVCRACLDLGGFTIPDRDDRSEGDFSFRPDPSVTVLSVRFGVLPLLVISRCRGSRVGGDELRQ